MRSGISHSSTVLSGIATPAAAFRAGSGRKPGIKISWALCSSETRIQSGYAGHCSKTSSAHNNASNRSGRTAGGCIQQALLCRCNSTRCKLLMARPERTAVSNKSSVCLSHEKSYGTRVKHVLRSFFRMHLPQVWPEAVTRYPACAIGQIWA